MGDHDHSYKLLFSHPEMLRDLLAGFVESDWVAGLDFSTLERVSCAYVSDDLQGRASDIVWRVRSGDRYVYIAIEFQSTVEQGMALRVLAYVVLLYQELLREEKVSLDDGLPIVVPIVLYNGAPPWSAPKDFASLLCESHEGTEEYRPQFRYLLIDEGRYADRDAAVARNLVATLFWLEHGCRRERIKEVANALMDRLASEGLFSLRRAFGVWLDKVFRARLSRVPGAGEDEIWEEQSMLADRVDEWAAELRQEGHQRGEATLLTCLLRKRFGEIPAHVLTRLGAAPAAQLEQWGGRLFDAGSLSEVFDAD